MTARDDLVELLRSGYTIVQRGSTTFLITHVADDELDVPIQLELDTELFERYVSQLTSGGDDYRTTLGLVQVHLEEDVQFALALGDRVHALGVRPSRRPFRPEWFVVRTESLDPLSESVPIDP